MERSDMMKISHLFLSYAREDGKQVESLYDRLEAAGFRPWMDRRDLLPGQVWESRILQAVREATVFITCLSRHSINKRGFLQKEIKTALDEWQKKLESDIYLIPLRLAECELPPSLQKFQCFDLFVKESWDHLCRALEIALRDDGWTEETNFTERRGSVSPALQDVKLLLEEWEGIPVVCATGFFDGITSQGVGDRITNLIQSGRIQILLDMEQVTHSNSEGIACLIELAGTLSKSGKTLAVSGLSDAMKKIFSMMGLAKYVPIFTDKRTAISSLSKKKI